MKKICARFAVAVMLSVSGALTAWLIACGPWLTEYVTVRAIHPADVKTFGTGSLGVVRPPMARRYLVHAYRAWTGKPALPNGLIAPSALDGGYDVIEKWSRDVMTVTGAYGNVSLDRNTGQDYQAIRNCQNDAFATASRTLAARIVKYGSSSAHVADWVAAQTAVFTNCGNAPLTLPPAPRPNADALERADRAYQTAAAYFYAMQYEEAARRFRAIADDPTSPWRPYGHYLAARATIRRAVVPDESAATRDRLLLEAIRELQLTIADPKAAALAKSAAGLLDYIDTRRNPAARLHALSQLLSTAPRVSDQQVADYQILLDRQVGDSVEFGYDAIGKRSAMVEGDDLADWILAMQGSGDQAAARAVARWKETSSVPWLVAALWRTAATDAVAPSLLEAASKLPRTSPAFPTVAFLRARMLIDRGEGVAPNAAHGAGSAVPGRKPQPAEGPAIPRGRFVRGVDRECAAHRCVCSDRRL